MKNILKGEIVYLVKPLAFLSVVVVVALILISISFNQISSIISKTNTAKSTQQALNKKVATLIEVDEIVSGDTTFLDVVLPSKAVTLYGLSQIKKQAAVNSLIISNIKTGSTIPLKNGISRTVISFEVEGAEQPLYEFLNSFSRVLPLMNIEKLKITRASIVRAAVTLNVYSTELPKTIPSLTSSVSSLSTEEIKLLRELSTFEMPQFVEPKTPESSTKVDPFN